MQVKGKTIVVTGGGSGIGRVLVLGLLNKGARVAAVDLNEETLKETQALAGDKETQISTHVVNIADKPAVEGLPQQILENHPSIDGLINNAGIIQPFVKINDLNYDQINKVMHVNFYGTVYMTKTFLPELLKRPEAHIVNVSSMGGFLPVPGQSVYGASKAAVKLFTEGLYAELADTNVNVTVVIPGATETNITKNSGVETPSMGESSQKFKALPAEKAAELIIKGIERNKYQIFVGNDSKMLNILYRLSPQFATDFIAKQMKALLIE